MNDTLFSVIIPCYNSSKTIRKTIESVMKQENVDMTEIIICDDRSTDNLSEIINEYAAKLNIRYYRVDDDSPKGPASARNVGIRESLGKWLIFLDSDDLLSEGALKVLHSVIDGGAENLIWCPFRHNYKEVYPSSLLSLQGKCFERKFLLDNGILFNACLYTEEDYHFNSRVRYEIRAQGKKYFKKGDTIICEHIDNSESMVHSIDNYWVNTYKDFAVGYLEPSLIYGIKYPSQREFFLRESVYAFFMLYYRFIYIRDEENKGLFRILENEFKKLLLTYNLKKEDILPFLNDVKFNQRTMEHACCDLNIDPLKLIDTNTFISDFKDTSTEPLFSIIIPCFNCHNTINYTLDSIVNQDFKDYEILICDDRSTDNFMDKVWSYNDRALIRYFRTEDGTMHCPSNPRQLGMDNAKGKWIIFVDCDDALSKTSLNDFKKCIDDNAQNFIWGGFSKGQSLYCNSRIALHGKAFNTDFLRRYNIRFNEHIFMEEDYDFIQKVLFTIEGDNLLYYIWEKNFYNYTVNSENSSMSSVGNKYSERTYESFLQSRFEPLFNAYLMYPNKRGYFKEKIIYSIYLCYFKYCYFTKRNGDEFMREFIRRTRRNVLRALELTDTNVTDLLKNVKDEQFVAAREEIMIDDGITDTENNESFEYFVKKIINL